MKYHNKYLLFLIILMVAAACKSSQQVAGKLPSYKPASQQLHNDIVRMDSLMFSAYNNCQMDIIENIFSEDIEFFHDQGGLSTSKSELLDALKKNICNKVTRELIPGTIEVYGIPNYGAVEMGWHKFHNKLEPDAISKPSKFVTIWKQENRSWKMTRVISLH